MNPELTDLAERYWEASVRAHPVSASLLGLHEFDGEIDDLSRDAEDARIAELDGFAADAEAIDPEALSADEQVSREQLLFDAATTADELRSRMLELRVDGFRGPHLGLLNSAGQLPITSAEHAASHVERLCSIGAYFDQAIGRLRQGLARDRTPPVVGCEIALRQIDAYLATPLDEDGFVAAPRRPEDFDDASEAEWRDEIATEVTTTVRPAYERYRAAIAGEVLPNARPPERSGICWIPDGEQVYARALRRHTSLATTPYDIHQTGLDEIARLEDEYRVLGSAVLGTEDVAAMYERLRTDPELRFETPEQIVSAAEGALVRAEVAVPAWFGTLPTTPCIVQPMPPIGAEDSTIAYYMQPAIDGSRPGTYFVNTTQPTTRTRYEAEALAFHESVPGHHLQLALNQELDLPTFRRHAFVTVFHEGWGLYTERLADEMGLYSGDVERLGMLSFDSWRSCRLVVDTGMHALGWSRDQAIAYMTEHSPQAANNIVNEIDRYIAWPGQAVAYKTGQLAMMAERRSAQEAMGGGFEIRTFHDVLLGAGSVPLPVMQRRVRAWAAG